MEWGRGDRLLNDLKASGEGEREIKKII